MTFHAMLVSGVDMHNPSVLDKMSQGQNVKWVMKLDRCNKQLKM
jgi:hypothetical protein